MQGNLWESDKLNTSLQRVFEIELTGLHENVDKQMRGKKWKEMLIMLEIKY